MESAGPEQSPVRRLLAPPGDGGPTVMRILFGAQLRRLRVARRISVQQAAEAIRATPSKISRMETGRVGFRDRDIADLLTFYGVTDPQERDALRALASRASVQGWWHDYSDILPGWFEPYVGLEEAASQIRSYEIQFVPGLLQTEAYARAVTLLGHPRADQAEIDRRVSLRLARQELLTKESPPRFWTVMDEAVLRRPIGDAGVMSAQLRHLLELSGLPNVTLQILPFHARGHAATAGAFSILRFAEPDLPDVVYIEQLTSALYLDKRDTVDQYLAVMERLALEAASASDSSAMLAALLR
jgi:transcriptional regulator with XRE-family HTH domain